MAYNDPYANRQPYRDGDDLYQQSKYGEPTTDYNPYESRQPHQTYDQGVEATKYDEYGYTGGYRDEGPSVPYNAYAQDSPYGLSVPDNLGQAVPNQTDTLEEDDGKEHTKRNVTSENSDAHHFGRHRDSSGFERGEFGQTSFSQDKSAGAIRNYRIDHRGRLWTKGTRAGCIGRFICCTLLVTVFLFIGIVLSLALWIRPPNIEINDVAPQSRGSTVQFSEAGVEINLGVNISVANPNYFDVNFKEIKAEIFYPIGDTPIGGGTSKNVVFRSNTLTNWTFPFSIDYEVSKDPGGQIVLDLARKCGLTGQESQLTVDYKITLRLQILFITISPSVSNSFNFDCPLEDGDLKNLLEIANIDLNQLPGLLSGTST